MASVVKPHLTWTIILTCDSFTLQVFGATGLLGVLVPRLVEQEEGVTGLEHAKEEPRVWVQHRTLKSVKCRIAQVNDGRA